MRIQHNIPAMTSYRNYITNSGALAKNLEKLSSGYRINRAGDDAAGLAISEKMRAQVTGLEVAQKNAKDGISLVQTAEGALTEVHSMLNRMYELAEQSANGTYSDDVDREQLQKEIESLRTEVNRIADSSNFNGINLLDGSMTIQKAGSEKISISGSDRILRDVKTADDGEDWEVTGEKTILDVKSETATPAAFKVDLSKVDFGTPKFKDTGAVAQQNLNQITLTISGTKIKTAASGVGSITAQKNASEAILITGGGANVMGADAKPTALMVGNAMIQAAAGSASATQADVEINGVKWTMEMDGITGLKFTQKNNPATADEARANFDATITLEDSLSDTVTLPMTGQIKAGTEVTTAGVPTGAGSLANTVFKITEDDIKDGAVITLGESKVKLAVGGKTSLNTGDSDVVDLTGMEEGEIDLNMALSKISNKISTFNYKWDYVDADGNKEQQTIAFKVGVSDNGDGYPTGLAIQRTDDINNTKGSGKRAITDLETLAGVFKMNYSEELEEQSGLTLQIGDTAQDFNKLTVDIKDMHADAMGIGDIDVSTQAGAAEAMDKIKGAINYVSDVRGTLGATQNRLDHTISNLAVMQENIQDAESTIRDTDVAAEMMAYTKNSILNQAAQAMLAQANQLPQGMLQLLG